MASVVRMPSVLADATEAAIANWLVGPGDTVAVGDPMVEIETEKAIVEYQAEEPGIVGRLVLAAGEAGEVGAAMAVLIGEGETDADIDAALGGGAVAPAASGAPRPAARAAGGASAVQRAGGGRRVGGAHLRQPARAQDRAREAHRPGRRQRHRAERSHRAPRHRAAGGAAGGGSRRARTPRRPRRPPRPRLMRGRCGPGGSARRQVWRRATG